MPGQESASASCATVCYMSEEATPARVGVRELRQNLSVYLRRVEAGETLEVTDHGRSVARLSPQPANRDSGWERLVAEGRIDFGSGDLLAHIPLAVGDGPSLGEILRQMRDEEDR